MCLKSFMGDEEGQSMVEYALIIALVAIVLVVGLTALGTGLNNTINSITSSL
ncbi:MAG: Flp family type IVb pilin [bacterium]